MSFVDPATGNSSRPYVSLNGAGVSSSFAHIECESCHKTTGRPRYYTSWFAISVAVMTFKTPTNGIRCVDCARTQAILHNVLTGVAGWWGFPWGPIYSIQCIVLNAGAQKLYNQNADLDWNSCLAAQARGDVEEAYSLARIVSKSISSHYLEARDLADALAAHHPDRTTKIIDPWKPGTAERMLRLAAGFALPGLLVAALAYGIATLPPPEKHRASPVYEAPPVERIQS